MDPLRELKLFAKGSSTEKADYWHAYLTQHCKRTRRLTFDQGLDSLIGLFVDGDRLARTKQEEEQEDDCGRYEQDGYHRRIARDRLVHARPRLQERLIERNNELVPMCFEDLLLKWLKDRQAVDIEFMQEEAIHKILKMKKGSASGKESRESQVTRREKLMSHVVMQLLCNACAGLKSVLWKVLIDSSELDYVLALQRSSLHFDPETAALKNRIHRPMSFSAVLDNECSWFVRQLREAGRLVVEQNVVLTFSTDFTALDADDLVSESLRLHPKYDDSSVNLSSYSYSQLKLLLSWLIVTDRAVVCHSTVEGLLLVKLTGSMKTGCDSSKLPAFSEEDRSLLLLRFFVIRAKTELESMNLQLRRLRSEALSHMQQGREQTASYLKHKAYRLEQDVKKWNQRLDQTFLSENIASFQRIKQEELGVHQKRLQEVKIWTTFLSSQTKQYEHDSRANKNLRKATVNTKA